MTHQVTREILRVICLALSDFLYEWRLSLCLTIALAAVLAPLFVLMGLKVGLIQSMKAELLENPVTREIIPLGSGAFGPEWFAEMRSRPEVAFVIPKTRSIAATIQIRNPKKAAAPPVIVDLVPTSQGDPLVPEPLLPLAGVTSVLLSQKSAAALGIAASDLVEGRVSRTLEGQREVVTVPLTVVSVLPEWSFPRDGVFAQLDLLRAVEDFRDGLAVQRFAWQGNQVADRPEVYSSYRLFAANLEDIAVLRDALRDQGLDVRTRSAQVELMQQLNRDLSLVFWLVATLGGGGFLMSLGASLWANVDRKRYDLSLLRLLGVRWRALIWFPITHALSSSVCGVAIAIAGALAMSFVLNQIFAQGQDPENVVCLLRAEDLIAGFVATVACSVLSAVGAGFHSCRIDPGEGIRNA